MSRFLIIKSSCPYCREAMRVMGWLNLKLPVNKQIKIIDNYMWEKFGWSTNLIHKKFTEEDSFTGYPFLYMNGIVVEVPQKELLKPFLESYLKEDFVI